MRLVVLPMPVRLHELGVGALAHAKPDAVGLQLLGAFLDRRAIERVVNIGSVPGRRRKLVVVHADHYIVRVDESRLVLKAPRSATDDRDALSFQNSAYDIAT